MKAYPEYKDSGVEWIGKIPNNWEVVKIRHLSKVRRGASPRPIDDPKYFDENGEYAWVRIADVSASEKYLLNTTQRLSELGNSLSVKREPGNIFLSIAGSVGKPIITKIKCCIHDGFVYFTNLEIDNNFMYYLFLSGQPYRGLGKWGTQLNLNTDTIGDIYIPKLDSAEYTAIANFLDHKTTQIDESITKRKQLIELLQEQRKAIINEAVTKGINPKAKMKDSGIEWIGEIPEHWEVKRFKFWYDLITSKTSNNGIKIGLENIQSKTGQFLNTNTKFEGEGVSFNVNDILYGKLRPYLAKVYLSHFQGSAVGDFFVFRPTQNLNPEFAFHRILSHGFIEITNSSTYGAKMPRVSWEFISNLYLPFPDKKEQEEIAHYIQNQTQHINSEIESTEKEITLLEEYRQSLITEAVTGKIDVRDYKLD